MELSNSAIEIMLGYTKEELLGMSFKEFTHPDDLETEMPMVCEIIESKRDQYVVEKRYFRKNGQVIWVRLFGTSILGSHGEMRGLAIIEDITERKRALEALWESEEKIREQNVLLETIIHSMKDSVTLRDKKGNLLLSNAATDYWFGSLGVAKKAGDISYDSIFTDLDGVPVPLSSIAMVRALQGETVDNMKLAYIHAEGERFIEVNAAPVLVNGELSMAVAFIHDITDLIISQRALEEAKRQALTLVEDLKIIDHNKNEFLNALSHELRNPLASIVAGFSLLNLTEDKHKTAQAKEIMQRQITQLCNLIDDLLDITRITNNKIELKKERIDLNKLVSSIVEDHSKQFGEKGVRIDTVINKNSIYIDGDIVRLTQTIGNLVHNALKFTKTGGEIHLSVYEEQNDVVIQVQDNGIGIKPEFLPNLFEPFRQADRSLDRRNGGLGLGLSIAKGIAELHGGSVSATSDGLGKGSMFIIRLPLSDDNLKKDVAENGSKRSLFTSDIDN